MSQICKFHLRGSCKYGHRCHFLHEDPYHRDYSRSHDRSYSHQNYNNNNYSRNYSQNYERGYSQTHYGDYSQNYYVNSRSNYVDSNYAAKQNYNRYHVDNSSYVDSNYVAKQNHNKYHVDHRQNQKELRNSESISLSEFLEIVNLELMQHEGSHMWPFTVVAPVKDFGNLLGFKDCSPEEVRYQYYESMSENTMFEFEKNITEARDELMKYRRIFTSKSSEAINILQTMMQQSKNSTNSLSTNFSSSEVSTFSFDLRKLHENQPSIGMESSSEHINVVNFNHLPVNSSTFPTNEAIQTPFSGNSMTTFNAKNTMFDQLQTPSQINTFSFNSSHINSNQGNAAQPPDVYNHPEIISDVTDNAYSDIEKLSSETLELFHAKTFKTGSIPIVPPPRQLCLS